MSSGIYGAFKAWKGSNGANGTTGTETDKMNFDASRCSSIYGKSNTVTPLSLTTIYLVKY